MRPSTICNFLFLIVCIFLQTNLFAQSPSLVNFRGQLLNSGGQPVTSTVSIDLRVFPTETGGAQLYLENVGNVEVRNGQYAFQFGTNGSPDFSAVIKQNAETWVELTLDGNALPRQRFVSVPYALSAGSSQITAGSITREMLAPGVLVDGNGSYNTSQGGGVSIDNPYGWSGDVVTHSGSTYTVPAGKILVIVSGDVIKLSTGEAFRQLQSGYSIVPSDTTISSEKGWTGVLNNSIDDITPVIIKDSPFQVPVGKNLIITTSAYEISVSGKEVGWMNSRFMLIEQGKTINHPDGFHQGALSGYLIDANKSLGSGFGGSKDPSQIASGSITRDMLSQEVLDEINASITPDRLSPEVSQKLNSSGQISGQIISVPKGTPPPSGYTKISDSRIEWKLESNSNSHQQGFYNQFEGKLMSINDKLYSLYFGGGFSLRHYDENSSSWPLVENSSPPNNHGTNGGTLRDRGRGGNFGNKIYIVGGQGFNNDDIVSVYNTETGTWQSGPNLPVYNSEYPPYVESVEDSLFVFSMLDSSNYRSFRLDGNSSSWTEITVDYSNPVGMNWGGESISHGKLIYFIGGSSGIIQKFNSETLTISYITTIPDWSNSGTSSDTAFIIDGQIYLFRNVGHFYKYDLTKETWTRVINQPVSIGASAVYGQKMIVHKGKPWISGGSLTLVSDTANAGLSRSFGTYSGTFVPALYSYTDTNSSSGSGGSTPAPGSVTTSMLNETILKYLKPEISQQPLLNGPPFNGQSISLSALTEGKYLTYQWKKNGNNLNGETNATLTISEANPSLHDGNYTLVVTNDFGSVETTTILVNIFVTPHTVDLNSTVDLEMLWVEPGTFTMGSPTTETGRQADREDEHNVSLTQGFYLGKYEVTQAQYEAVMTGNTDGLSTTPSKWPNNPNRPVEKVSWVDAQIFLTRLNSQQSANIPAGWAYVLPTESQWEYACRAGTTTMYSWGNDINSSRANYNWDGDYNTGVDFKQTRDVGQYAANPLGFFDMHGNVSEWTADWYQAAYPTGNPVVDPTGPASGSNRVIRGGSWGNDGTAMRSAERSDFIPSGGFYGLGFRVGFQKQ